MFVYYLILLETFHKKPELYTKQLSNFQNMNSFWTITKIDLRNNSVGP